MRYLRGPFVALLAFIIGVVISPIRFFGNYTSCRRNVVTTSYRSTQLVKLRYDHSRYDSASEANAVFDQRIAEAVQIIDLTPRLDGFRQVVGRRAVAKCFDKETNERYATVFWTEGGYLHSISASSLRHVLEFEIQHVLGYDPRSALK